MSVTGAFKLLVQALNDCGIRFTTVGSVASSARGLPRSTMDVDVLAAIPLSKIPALVDRLGHDWYADREAIAEAIRRERSFNVIYNPLIYKFDIFPAVTPFHAQQLQRSTAASFPLEDEVFECQVASAEDIVLSKLVWYRQSGGTLDQQLRDVEGIIAVNPAMDRAYLSEWAKELGVSDLLIRFLQ